MTRTELLGDRLDFRARGRFRDRERVGGQPPVREESLGHAYAADLERLQTFGLESATDDELGRTAADVDDQTGLDRPGQLVCDAKIDQARLFMSADDVDRETECALRLRQKLPGILRHAKGIGRHRAHRRRMQPREPFAEPGEAFERHLHR